VIAAGTAELPVQLWQIFYTIVLPVLLLAGTGCLLQKLFRLDLATLRVLNFYFVIPAIVYHSVLTSQVGGGQVLVVVGFALSLMAGMSVLTLLAAWLRGVPMEQRRALLMTTIFHNSGNYGLPLQDLAFRARGLAVEATTVQTYVMITQNFTTFTLGILLAAGGASRRRWRENLRHMAKFPPLYALGAALLTIQIERWLGGSAETVRGALRPFWEVIVRVRGAFVPIALVTLGAQLMTVARGRHNYHVSLSVMLRLLCGPAVGLGLVYLFGLSGFMAQVLLISTTTPTAVNCMLLCLEFDNHPDYAARAVFYSTLLSPLTVTLVIYLARSGLLPGLAF